MTAPAPLVSPCPMTTDVVLLAAGLSTRMGAVNKLLLPVGGEPLVRRSARIYASLTDLVHVVVGYEAEAVLEALKGVPHRAVFNDDYRSGQQSSVAAGLNVVGAKADAVVIALSDQPLLTRADLRDLVSHFAEGDRDKIIVPYLGDLRGNPVIVPRGIVSRLISQRRNPGCRRFIDENPDLVARYEAPNNHFTTDIDTPDDARRLGQLEEFRI